ncbi:MAG TPA: hypothetical protein VH722_17745 [Alphaproteobacteria bacterium]|nr:hypothetical protein [Alphaproteobacteria bacterium]
MFRQISVDELHRKFGNPCLVPHAILRLQPSSLSEHLGIKFSKYDDDLDKYEGAYIETEFAGQKNAVALKHYKGEPINTVTIYFSYMVRDGLDKITEFVHHLVREFKLDDSALFWERKDNPDL